MKALQRPNSFRALHQMVQSLDQQHWEWETETRNIPRYIPPNRRNTTIPATQPSANNPPNLVNNAANRKPPFSTWSQEEKDAKKDRRRREGLCLWCAAKGHLAANCPKRPVMGRPTYTLDAETDNVVGEFLPEDTEEQEMLDDEMPGNEEVIQELLGEP